MIISVQEIKEIVDFKGWDDKKIERKLKAIEETIRKYTNNNFQNRFIRIECPVVAQKLYGVHTALKVGDTVQVTESMFNNGLYVITNIEGKMIELDKNLLDESHVLVTKIEYPDDVVECCINLMDWEVNHRAKLGIKSETLSRHSVTYEDSSAMFNGYPISILGGVKLRKKARF